MLLDLLQPLKWNGQNNNMTVQAINTTAGTLTYSNEGITISANSTVTIPNPVLTAFYSDPNVVSDISAGNLEISDTVTTYTGTNAIDFLQSAIQALISFDKSGSGSITAAQPVIGTPVANATVIAATSGASCVTFITSGTFSATIAVDGSPDSVNWFPWNFINHSGVVKANSNTATEMVVPCGSFSQVRLRCTAYTSGTVSVTWNSSSGVNIVLAYSLKAASFLATASMADGAGTALTSTLVGSKQAIDVNVAQNSPPRQAQSPAAPAAATVGVSSAQVLASNANRTGLLLINTSVNTIYLGLGATAVIGSGITLYPGGTWEMNAFAFTTGAINAIASAASSNLAIQELS